MDFNYTVRDQRIIKATGLNSSVLRSGTRGVATLVFSFVGDWKDFPQKAIGFSFDPKNFEHFEPIIGSKCLIPDEFCDRSFYIQIVGADGNKRIITNIVKVEVQANG